MAKVYAIINGVQYYGYDIVSLDDRVSIGEKYVFLNHAADNLAFTKINELKNECFTPKQGSEINVIPPCSESIDNIRKCYTVKKGYDTGVCNVFSEWPTSKRSSIYSNYAICPMLGKVFLYRYLFLNPWIPMEFKALVDAEYSRHNLSMTDARNDTIYGNDSFFERSDNEAWINYVFGTLNKPCIPIKNLNLSTGDELTPDVLALVHMTGSVDRNSADAVKNFVLQLNVLNNYNWRNYPHTMYLLFNLILRKIDNSICRAMHYHPSKYNQAYNKIVRQFLNIQSMPTGAISAKDFILAQGMLAKTLNIDGTMFVSPASLYNKLTEHGISIGVFEQYFNSIVKISPKINNRV